MIEQLNIPYGQIRAVEFFNEFGRIFSLIDGILYEFQVTEAIESSWLAARINGELAYFLDNNANKVLIDRLEIMEAQALEIESNLPF
jgi:hypothetical protein